MFHRNFPFLLVITKSCDLFSSFLVLKTKRFFSLVSKHTHQVFSYPCAIMSHQKRAAERRWKEEQITGP